jgi:hypothetical protein
MRHKGLGLALLAALLLAAPATAGAATAFPALNIDEGTLAQSPNGTAYWLSSTIGGGTQIFQAAPGGAPTAVAPLPVPSTIPSDARITYTLAASNDVLAVGRLALTCQVVDTCKDTEYNTVADELLIGPPTALALAQGCGPQSGEAPCPTTPGTLPCPTSSPIVASANAIASRSCGASQGFVVRPTGGAPVEVPATGTLLGLSGSYLLTGATSADGSSTTYTATNWSTGTALPAVTGANASSASVGPDGSIAFVANPPASTGATAHLWLAAPGAAVKDLGAVTALGVTPGARATAQLAGNRILLADANSYGAALVPTSGGAPTAVVLAYGHDVPLFDGTHLLYRAAPCGNAAVVSQTVGEAPPSALTQPCPAARASGAVSIRGANARVRLACPASGFLACPGTVRLTLRAGGRHRTTRARSLSIDAGRSATATIALSAADRRFIRRAHPRRATVTTTSTAPRNAPVKGQTRRTTLRVR